MGIAFWVVSITIDTAGVNRVGSPGASLPTVLSYIRFGKLLKLNDYFLFFINFLLNLQTVIHIFFINIYILRVGSNIYEYI